MKSIVYMLLFCTFTVVILGHPNDHGALIPYRAEKLPNGEWCIRPGYSCSERGQCCMPVDGDTYTYGCGRAWSEGSKVCFICNRESSMC
uniref:Toxin ICK-12 n=1 Tax=Trittame loki TaxID=1295018 RepID=ICK12_TRILK|nr:RecName: Full=Toxin ICK-12; Flags: Precursor [Trittame loki]